MVVKRLILVSSICLTGLLCSAQKTVECWAPDHNVKVNVETASIFYQHDERSNYQKFGFGLGAEFEYFKSGRWRLSFAPMFNYVGAEEEFQTYVVEPITGFYYRSTVLTGKYTLSTPLYLKYDLTRSWQFGLGYQPEFLLNTMKRQYERGISSSEAPDIRFHNTSSAIIGQINYRVDGKHMISAIGQYGVGPVILGADKPTSQAFRLQISRGILTL
jgi:hypothetical protein